VETKQDPHPIFLATGEPKENERRSTMDNGELLARKQGALQACDEANQSYQTALRDYRKARRV
ncbi:hypothetical protein COV21_01970, partial [Candidatus Woesearchaeota archaeon CG10_big_fil_rev_8_21_14_0_10_45_5]